MIAGPSMLSLSASGLYGVVVLACIAAAVTAARHRQLPRHWQTWLIVALLFAVFAILRLVAAEELARDAARKFMRASDSYSERRSLQAPMVSTVIVLAGAAALLALYRWNAALRGRRNQARMASLVAVVAMLFLIALRLASLHAVDSLLYGPLKLNWVIDLGASLTVLVAAVCYILLVQKRP